ncbi:type II toxin-antitoxin system HipA family toxin [Kribbella speibonae]|uniref:Type II toxin-antitoxin system HipA family toxin n=1 Tax=Kribbella speibonae TaxID=1572660 RepID=A0A4R0IWS4_9ACTN|nr:type II toxin-antitoxin system HipA family toxin [Kribbella speibonae]
MFLADRRVGTLGYSDGNTWFDYEDLALDHPVFGQAFEGDPTRRRTASGSVPEWFANLLPEPGSGLRSLIGQELGRTNPHDFHLLSFLGQDLPGAVRVVPDSDLGDIPELADKTPGDVSQPVRFSLAGVQAKFSMRWEGKGLVLPMSGQGGDWIVKLPDRRFPAVPINEYAMLTWGKLCGIDVPDIALLSGAELHGLPDGLIGSDELAFAVRRFDRSAAGRIHQEDFAQVRETAPDLKYERASYSGIARILTQLCPEDLDEYVRRLAAMVVMGNLDAHLKNWTLRYPDGRQARLSPAYDLVSVAAYPEPEFRKDELAFRLNGGRIARNITSKSFRELAEHAEVDTGSVLETVAGTVTALVGHWPDVKDSHALPEFLVEHMDERLRNLALVKEFG